MTYTLDPALISEFEENGAVCLRKVFDRRWLDSISRGIEKNLQQASQYSESIRISGGPGAYFDDYCNWQRIEEFKDYAYNSPAKFIVAQLLRTKYVAFYHEHVLIKEPGTLKETPWHHDQSYYPIDGFKVCSIWMPVDPVPKDTCVQFVAGSHKWDWFLPIKFSTDRPYPKKGSEIPDREFKPVPDINGNRNQYKILHWDVEPGDCIVFHMRTLHGAPGNLSAECSRRVFSTRWLGDDAVLACRPWNVSPPFLGGLQYGDKAISDEFPKVWEEETK